MRIKPLDFSHAIGGRARVAKNGYDGHYFITQLDDGSYHLSAGGFWMDASEHATFEGAEDRANVNHKITVLAMLENYVLD